LTKRQYQIQCYQCSTSSTSRGLFDADRDTSSRSRINRSLGMVLTLGRLPVAVGHLDLLAWRTWLDVVDDTDIWIY
jgi:hypothetical protein